MSSNIVVVGSMVMDLVAWLPPYVRGRKIARTLQSASYVGGKGFNQAVTAARLGAQVAMVGRVGADEFGDEFLRVLAREGVDTCFVTRDPEVSTTFSVLAHPRRPKPRLADRHAHDFVSVEDVEQARDVIAKSDTLLLQFHLPIKTSLAAAAIARSAGSQVFLNPAPGQYLSDTLWSSFDWIVPNGIEAQILTGQPVTDLAGAQRAGQILVEGGAKHVIITLGALGAVLVSPEAQIFAPALPVVEVDPTGASDAFIAALAVGLSERMTLDQALALATAAGAYAVTIAGTEPGLPRRAVLDPLLKQVELQRIK